MYTTATPLEVRRAIVANSCATSAFAERGRWLVHDEDARGIGERPRDLDHLLLCETQRPHRRVRIDGDAQRLEDSRGATPHRRPVDDPGPARRRLAEENVLRNREVRHEAQLLIDGADPEPSRGGWIGNVDSLPVEQNLAGVPPHGAAEDLHQRRLARAIFAEQDVHLTGTHLERGVAQCLDSRIAFADASHLQKGWRVHDHVRRP